MRKSDFLEDPEHKPCLTYPFCEGIHLYSVSSTKFRSLPKVSSTKNKDPNATIRITPSTKARLGMSPQISRRYPRRNEQGTTSPRTKFGAEVVTVALKFVPNCSAETIMKTAQYPVPKPRRPHSR